eukprot:CAMPEP_0119336612 /NCGR_PEP_ID=MMETSP1333-20130426/92216_1 /TAXON_ID=418940 /ORGANISM="Scyphosphaera apsteinii, Strain RCC1455" /LENGTH=41 /DNA_ID= /DNA_START= /DNA_END= /DNA_ORIENTATION=
MAGPRRWRYELATGNARVDVVEELSIVQYGCHVGKAVVPEE